MKKQLTVLGLVSLWVTACGDKSASYSILPASQTFHQSTANTVNDQVDVLWVIDNSGSMQPLQTNLTNNFNSFITQFVSKGYDFHIGVTTSDAYLAGTQFNNNSAYSKFRDGAGSVHTGIFNILPTTLNLNTVFVKNATQGTLGSGDERAFSSFKAALNDPQNAGFLRPSSYLAVIILSDEDDFSSPTRPEGSWAYTGGVADHSYTYSGLETVDSYVSYLDTLTNSTGATRRYGVSAITVLDSACAASHISQSPSTIIGQRYIDLANKTGGTLGSICDSSYANSLTSIQQKILELSTQFYLDRAPIVTSIQVTVNNMAVVQDTTNGWSYNQAANSIMFHGSAVPAGGAVIQVNFDPAGIIQ